jgi:feruloyl esterase
MGAKRAEAFMRLFMIPGMHHCGGGIGPSDFGQIGVSPANRDPATSAAAALEAWVEQGRVPEQVIARQTTRPGAGEGQAVRTGLICGYPKRAKLMAGADPMRAGNYRCVDP